MYRWKIIIKFYVFIFKKFFTIVIKVYKKSVKEFLRFKSRIII